MKKTFVLLLMIVTLCFASTYAEGIDFSVRGGITFSSSKSDIITYETQQKSEIKEYTTKNEYNYAWLTDDCIECRNIKFAGYDNVNVVYYFDDQNNLVSIIYAPESTEEKAAADKQYDTFNTALQKYGDIIATGNEYLPINGETMDAIKYFNCEDFHYDLSGAGGTSKRDSTILRFAQRLDELTEGYVDVKVMEFVSHSEMVLSGLGKTTNDYYHVVISYTFCTEKQLQDVRDAIIEKQNALTSDL